MRGKAARPPNHCSTWPGPGRILRPRRSWKYPASAPLRCNGTNSTEDVADYKADAAPGDFGAFIMLPEGVAKLYASDFVEGPFPEHYEPVESPVENILHPKVSSNPLAKVF